MNLARNDLSVDDLSPDQREVFEAIHEFGAGDYRPEQPLMPDDFEPDTAVKGEDTAGLSSLTGRADILTVGGFAGTGKSTVLGVFAAHTDLLIAYCAFTGRAASILDRKLRDCGVGTTNRTKTEHYNPGSMPYCGTIHSLMYRPCSCNKLSDPPVLEAPVVDSKTGKQKINAKTNEPMTKLVTLPRPTPPDCDCRSGRGWCRRNEYDRPYDLIVVDEASMVDDYMLSDLRRFGVPILAVGDHGQLPPVKGSGDLMQNPHLRLEKIHRQAEGNPIIALSRHVRQGGRLGTFKCADDRVAMRWRRDVDTVIGRVFAKADALLPLGILCWTNKMRIVLNGRVRLARGIRGTPRAGEIVICLRNYRSEVPAIYNGMRGVLTRDGEVGSRPWILDTEVEFPDEGLDARSRQLCAAQFNRERTFAGLEEFHERGIRIRKQPEAGLLFDFGYCLTVHKSQGSQFEHAVVFADRPENGAEETARFYYTAVTRASERLTVLR